MLLMQLKVKADSEVYGDLVIKNKTWDVLEIKALSFMNTINYSLSHYHHHDNTNK